MKNVKKVIALTACALLLVVGSVAGTIAFLSSTAQVKNTFTVGNVTITMDETDVDLYGVKDGETRKTDNEYKLIPGHEYVKDPIVHVGDTSEDSFLFVRVTNGISAIEDANNTVHSQMIALGWQEVDAAKGIYVYDRVVSASENIPVFAKVVVAEDADVSTYEDKELLVQACAIQKDGFDSQDAAFAKLPNDFKN